MRCGRLAGPICAGNLDAEQGTKVLGILRKLTRRNPYFGVVSSVMHAGSLPYQYQQPFVDAIVRLGPHAIRNIADADRALEGAIYAKAFAPMLVGAARAYNEVCGRAPWTCAPQREELLRRMKRYAREERAAAGRGGKSETAGFGQKISEMFREYFGDDEAVAVDRHIAAYLKKRAGAYKFPRSDAKKGTVHPKDFVQAIKVMRRLARECGVKPAALQVAAWHAGACGWGTSGAPRYLHLATTPYRPWKSIVFPCRAKAHPGQGALFPAIEKDYARIAFRKARAAAVARVWALYLQRQAARQTRLVI